MNVKNDAHLIETKVSSEQVFDGKLLHVRRDTVRLPDGSLATREYVVHPGAVLIVPVLPDGRLVVERQYRYPVGQVFIEFPPASSTRAKRRSPRRAASSPKRRAMRRRRGHRSGGSIRSSAIPTKPSISTLRKA